MATLVRLDINRRWKQDNGAISHFGIAVFVQDSGERVRGLHVAQKKRFNTQGRRERGDSTGAEDAGIEVTIFWSALTMLG